MEDDLDHLSGQDLVEVAAALSLCHVVHDLSTIINYLYFIVYHWELRLKYL